MKETISSQRVPSVLSMVLSFSAPLTGRTSTRPATTWSWTPGRWLQCGGSNYVPFLESLAGLDRTA